MNYKGSISFKYNVDTNGNPISINIVDEQHQISMEHSVVQLVQIPDEFYRLVVKNDSGEILKEIFDIEKLSVNSYRADYAHGLVYFSPLNSGKQVSVSYYGRGVELIHASRVFIDDNALEIKDLQELSDKANIALEMILNSDKIFEENEKIRQLTFTESEVNRNSEEIKRQLAEKERDKKYDVAEINRDGMYDIAEDNRNGRFDVSQVARQEEYELWKDIVMDQNNVANLQNQINEIKAQLANSLMFVEL